MIRAPTAVNVPRKQLNQGQSRGRRPHPPPTLLGGHDPPYRGRGEGGTPYKGVKYTPYSSDNPYSDTDTDIYYDTNDIGVHHPNDLIDHRLVAEAAAATGQTSSSDPQLKASVTLLVVSVCLYML